MRIMKREPIAFYNDITIKIDGGGIAFALRAREYKDVQCVMSYQKVTGALTPGAHPGSYNGQDAYSDMLVVQEHEIQNNSLLRGGANRADVRRKLL